MHIPSYPDCSIILSLTTTHVVTGKGSAGNTLWGEFKTYVMSESEFPASEKALFEDSVKEIRESVGAALDQLLGDIMQREQIRDEAIAGQKIHIEEQF